jgi:uncharacterized MAPEG superfamily protein
MIPLFASYSSFLAACATLAALLFMQILVADYAGIRAKHVPGMPVTGGHGDFHFRAVRAHGNTNEVLGFFLLLALLVLAAGANPRWSAIGAWGFVAARAAYATCYYADWRLPRSICFGLGLLAQFVLLVCVIAAVL